MLHNQRIQGVIMRPNLSGNIPSTPETYEALLGIDNDRADGSARDLAGHLEDGCMGILGQVLRGRTAIAQ